MGSASDPRVLAAWPLTLLRALEHWGVDVDALVTDVGVDAAAFGDAEWRIPRSVETRLWNAALAATGDDAIGIEVSRFTTAASFHGVSQAFMTSTTLREALDRVARYSRVTADDSVVVTREIDGEYVYTSGWDAGAPTPSPMPMVATLAALLRGARAMYGADLNPTRVEFLQSTPDQLARFEEFFRCPLRFDADAYLLAFRVDDVDRPVPSANQRLSGAAEAAIVEYLQSLDEEPGPTVSREVRNVLVDVIPGGEPDIRTVASELAMSGRTLQRRLGDEGTTFRDVLNDTRQNLAVALLRDPDCTIAQVSQRLGFSESAAFARAFRRWTGSAPSAFRARLQEAGSVRTTS